MKKLFFLLIALPLVIACNNNSRQFNALTESLKKSEEIIKEQNNLIYTKLAEKMRDPQTQYKAALWNPRAMQIKKQAEEMRAYIEQLSADLKKDHLFIKEQKAKELAAKVVGYRDSILATLNPGEFADYPTMQTYILKDMERFKKNYPLDVVADTLSNYFNKISVPAAQAMLQKISNEVTIMENFLAEYCDNQAYSYSDGYVEFSAIITQTSSYCKAGQPMAIMAGVGAFSAAAKPTITIDGRTIPLDNNGLATWSFEADKSPGKHKVPVTISFYNPDGTQASVSKNIEYEVAPID